ncbi:MAG: D-glycero-beta-D-manno-heptose-7-phosphate kinase [Betaproteobacteria bacterium]|nr:MAG: D-glycero-beta-D-manno-heptose-7-phosphate kinase [Betaproteobacteria bacterium]
MTPQPVREAVKNARVLVVGDIMLDRYWFGDVERISPEAPVPVVRVSRTEERLGGAANVAWNMAAIGSHPVLLSVVGDDEAAGSLEQHLAEHRIVSQLYRDPALSTTIKLRVIGRQQQLIRVDFENEPGHEALAAKLADFETKLPECDVVVLSDYGKGGLKHIERMIEQARDKGKPILVDPKGDDYSRYAGATLITPNRSELREVVGRWKDEADLTRRARELRESLGVDALLVTRSEEGMTLFSDAEPFHVAAVAREVYDVSGAGDTVIGIMAVMLASGQTLEEAVQWSNKAAGIVVGKLGTAVARPDELFE